MRNFIAMLSMALLLEFTIASSVASAEVPIGTPDVSDIEYPDDESPGLAEIELGKILFFDPRLSVNHNQSCATCHNPDLGFGDGLEKGIGTTGQELGRNTPHLYNLAWSVVFFWDGRAGSLEEQALLPIQSKEEMGMQLDLLVSRLNDVGEYRKRFKDVYGVEEISADEVGKAIAAFERSIITNNSPFDRYMAGDKNAMGPAAIRGMKLFQNKARCTQCHDGSNFTDDSFHNLGVSKDVGRAAIVNDKTLTGAFKTPGLRNVTLTGPYMHDGSLGSLVEVIEFYNQGGGANKNLDKLMKPLNLTDEEIMDLLAFLGALTDPVEITRPPIP